MSDRLKEIRALEDKYGLMLFRMAFTHLVDVGIRHLGDENVEESVKQIIAKSEEDEANGVTPFMTVDFQCAIVRCAAELAQFSILTLFAYIKKHVEISNGGSDLDMKKDNVSIIDAPNIVLTEDETAGEALLKFYRALGWNGTDIVDPRKVRTTKDVYNRLSDVMYKQCSDDIGVGMAMVNQGPSVDDVVPPEKVYLLDGWVTPAGEGHSG